MDSDIKTMLRLGEDSVCEFKSMRILGKRVAEPDAREIADEMAAVANTIGATSARSALPPHRVRWR